MGLHRLIAILLLLESRGRVKAEELANALETSKRTIHRDIETLCEAGVPITAVSGPAGGYSLMAGYRSGLRGLHHDDVVSLYASGIGVRPHHHTEASLSLRKALLTLEKILPPEYRSDVKVAKERFYFDPDPWWQEIPTLPYLDILRKAVWKLHKVLITYGSDQGEDVGDRTVRPYGLVVKNTEWYLVAFCELREEIRVFRCDRVQSASLSDRDYQIPDGFSLEEYWQIWVDRFKNDTLKASSYLVRLRMVEEPSGWSEGLEIIEDCVIEGERFVTVDLRTPRNALGSIWSWADNIEVLEPIELRQLVAERVSKLAARYER